MSDFAQAMVLGMIMCVTGIYAGSNVDRLKWYLKWANINSRALTSKHHFRFYCDIFSLGACVGYILITLYLILYFGSE